jgi:hypothetical protein
VYTPVKYVREEGERENCPWLRLLLIYVTKICLCQCLQRDGTSSNHIVQFINTFKWKENVLLVPCLMNGLESDGEGKK